VSISFQRAAKRYAQALLDDNAALFAGAGLSIKAGFVSWASLLRDIAEELGVDINSFSDLPSLAQFHLNQTGNRGGINQALVEEFVRIAEETESHRLIAGLPLRSIWTTNYDSLIEQAFQNAGKIVEVKRRPEDLTTTVRSRSAVVYKMHGDVTDLHRSVLTRDDYEQYDRERGVFRSALEGDLIQKTFLFAGFSFDDPNINFVLSKTRAALRQSQREHYYLLRCVKRKDFEDIKNPNDAVRDQRFGYAKALQDLRIADLSRYGIRSVLLDHYDQVLDFLRLVERIYRRNSVFISGAAEQFDPYEEQDSYAFIRDLASELVHKGFRIITGFGRGIGPSVVQGVLQRVEQIRSNSLDRHLMARPFPFHASENERKTLSRRYRLEMLKSAGIAIFVFGNKLDKKKIVDSSGMMEEFEVAKEYGIPCIAIGCTAGASKTIASSVLKDLGSADEHSPEWVKEFMALDATKTLSELDSKDIGLSSASKLTIELCEALRG